MGLGLTYQWHKLPAAADSESMGLTAEVYSMHLSGLTQALRWASVMVTRCRFTSPAMSVPTVYPPASTHATGNPLAPAHSNTRRSRWTMVAVSMWLDPPASPWASMPALYETSQMDAGSTMRSRASLMACT